MKLQWNQIDWKKAEELVNRLQIRIVKATLEKKWRLVKRLQYLMTNSFYAKALAVKRVATNKGKNTPGIDGAVWKTNEEKVKAILNLECQTYHAKPLRRIYIEKFGKKEKRPLGIPTMQDRAMQALQLLALEPVAETTADRISFGFRKYRSPEDAREYAFSVLCRKDSPQWILEGDIKSCFDKISHQWMMENIPTDKRILKEFMKCGYIEKGQLFPTSEGSPQGGVISPTYANMVLDGLEPMILDVAKQEDLIRKLNEVIIGWADYHHSTCAKKSYSTIDHRTWEMLWRWAKRRHPDKNKRWIADKYWKTHRGRKWTFMSDKNILFLMMDMPIVRKGQMALNKNPFLDKEYFELRSKKHRMYRKKAICSNRAAQINFYAL